MKLIVGDAGEDFYINEDGTEVTYRPDNRCEEIEATAESYHCPLPDSLDVYSNVRIRIA